MQPANQPAAPALPEGFDPALGELLERLKLTVHVEAFAREGLTSLVIAKELTDAQLKELGISRMGDRIALLKALQEAAGKGVVPTVTSSSGAQAEPATTEEAEQKREQLIKQILERYKAKEPFLGAAPSKDVKRWFIDHHPGAETNFGLLFKACGMNQKSDWPGGKDVLFPTSSYAGPLLCQALKRLLKLSQAPVCSVPEAPLWQVKLLPLLTKKEDVMHRLVENMILCKDLLRKDISLVEPPPSKPMPQPSQLESTVAVSQIFSSSGTLFSAALNEPPPSRQLSEFQITTDYISLALDHPLRLGTLPLLRKYYKELTIEWLRTKAHGSGLIPDGQLQVSCPELPGVPYTIMLEEDKRDDSSAHDMLKALSLMRSSHEKISSALRLDNKTACSLELPVVIVSWPKIRLFGVYRNPDHTFTADKRFEIADASDRSKIDACWPSFVELHSMIRGMLLAVLSIIFDEQKRSPDRGFALPAFALTLYNNAGGLQDSSTASPSNAPLTPVKSGSSGGSGGGSGGGGSGGGGSGGSGGNSGGGSGGGGGGGSQGRGTTGAANRRRRGGNNSGRPPSSLVKELAQFASLHAPAEQLGPRAVAISVVVKQPRDGSPELEIVTTLGGAHHIPAALSLAQPSEDNDKDDDTNTSDSSSSKECCWRDVFLFLPFIADQAVRSVAELQTLAEQLSEALKYLHDAGYIHRDVKRANVRWTGSEAYLIDFDIAAKWTPGQTLRGACGTPPWSAPEVREGEPYTDRADVWGLGMVLLYEGLPFVDRDSNDVYGLVFESWRPCPAELLYPAMGNLALVICSMLSWKPERRYLTVESGDE